MFTLDALHAVKKTFESVVEQEGDFLICVKGNVSNLKKRLNKHLDRRKKKLLRAETFEKGHGRIERRTLEMTDVLPWQTRWPHTHAVCRVTRDRKQIRRGETVSDSFEEVLYVASFSVDKHTPEKVLEFTRGHWGIENSLHHRKDRSMDEDRNRASEKNCGRTMCYLRSISALIFNRSTESLSVIQRRLSKRTCLLIRLLSCESLDEWERSCKPYKRKRY